MIYVEIELNDVTCPKRCPNYRTAEGDLDRERIREYFGHMGYRVGSIRLL